MRSKLDIPCLPFMGKDLVLEDTAKDLGITLDSNLTFDERIIKSVSLCMSHLSQINRTRHVFD